MLAFCVLEHVTGAAQTITRVRRYVCAALQAILAQGQDAGGHEQSLYCENVQVHPVRATRLGRHFITVSRL